MNRRFFSHILSAAVLSLTVAGCSGSSVEDDLGSSFEGTHEADEGAESDVLAQAAPRFPRPRGNTPAAEPTATADEPVGTPATLPEGGGSLPPVTSISTKGPFEVTIDQRGGGNTWIYHPTDLGRNGVKHPIFVWGTGATSTPSQYRDHFNLIASHGFVIISPNTGSVNARLLKSALDWIIAQNTASGSKFNGKLDTTKIAMGGHSLGSTSTFDAEQSETRLTTTLHIAGGSFDGRGSSKVKTPTAYICGGAGDIAAPQCEVDFRNVKPGIMTFYSVLQGAGHVDAARKALPGMIAWLRWHLAGEVQHKALFSPGGEFHKGIWKSQVKNWN